MHWLVTPVPSCGGIAVWDPEMDLSKLAGRGPPTPRSQADAIERHTFTISSFLEDECRSRKTALLSCRYTVK
jgi:hypothetical protein